MKQDILKRRHPGYVSYYWSRLYGFFRVLLFASAMLAPLAKAQAQDVSLPASHLYTDTNRCLLCHAQEIRNNDFLGDSSAAAWQTYDKHRDAFRLLHQGMDPGDAGAAERKRELVRRILGFDLREAFADDAFRTLSDDKGKAAQVETVKSCLRCHATWPEQTDHPSRRANHPPVPLEFGVSCQACHGPGLKWNEPHAYTWWRLVTPAGKQSLGFNDVRDAAGRARLCASCHVGNLAEGKFVKHEWYAGGHPPLPGFEYATFASQMPVHWRSLREKAQFAGKEADNPVADTGVEQRVALRMALNIDVPETEVRASYRAANFPPGNLADNDPFRDLPRFKEVVVSSVVTLEAYAALVKDYAAASQKQSGAWPEFAIYDCAACHHELRSGPGYPMRPFGKNIPGRPPALVWPTALAKLGVLHGAGYNAQSAAAPLAVLEQSWSNFERDMTAVPFGDAKRLAVSASALQEQLGKLIEQLKVSPFEERGARDALLFLTDAEQVETRDYHSARQIAWSIRELYKDLHSVPYGRDPTGPQSAAIEQLFSAPNNSAADVLVLKLPATQQQSIIENLQVTLPAITSYDPAWFHERLAELRERFKE